MPELAPTFGKFFTGEPLTEAEADYGELDGIIKATGVKVKHHWNCRKPRYHRLQDRIVMPLQSYFQTVAHYRGTLIHEILHHVEHRVGWIGSDHQAEMVAEIGTAFIECSSPASPRSGQTNIEKWLPKWAEGIKADPAYLFDAVAQAERARQVSARPAPSKESSIGLTLLPGEIAWPTKLTSRRTARKTTTRKG